MRGRGLPATRLSLWGEQQVLYASGEPCANRPRIPGVSAFASNIFGRLSPADRLIDMANGLVQIPQAVRLRLCRAAVQVIADKAGADILHIKGDAVASTLRPIVQSGSDVDILVRPDHIGALHAELVRHGWSVYSSFFYGSPFGHAQTYFHHRWGYLDAHRYFPGIERDSTDAFQSLWSARGALDVAGISASAPSVPAQAMILLLNSARNGGRSDIDRFWTSASTQERAAITENVRRFNADVAFAAAVGHLDQHRGARSYELWRVVTEGGTRAEEWRARILAAATTRERLLLILRAPAVNMERLEHQLGRRPTTNDVIRAFVARPVLAVRQWWSRRKGAR